MKTTELPKVHLRELTLNDVENRYQWCLDKKVIKHLKILSFFIFRVLYKTKKLEILSIKISKLLRIIKLNLFLLNIPFFRFLSSHITIFYLI
jgi:hypothetical protein